MAELDDQKFEQRMNSFEDALQKRSLEQLTKTIDKYLKEYAVDRSKITKVVELIKKYRPALIPDEFASTNVSGVVFKIIGKYNPEIAFAHRLANLKNCIRQGHTDAAEKIKAELLSNFPDRKKYIEEGCALALQEFERAKKKQNTECLNDGNISTQKDNATQLTSAQIKEEKDSGEDPSKETSSWESYKGKRYCNCNYRPFGVLNGANSNEVHPNCLSELRTSQSWTILIDETGVFKNNEGGVSKTNGSVVGIFVPHNVSLKACQLHACEEKSFKKIEEVILTLLNSRCGVLGLSSELLGFPAADPWIATIKELVKLAIIMLPYDRRKKVAFDVMIERREGFSEKNDLRLLEGSIKDEFARIYPSFTCNNLNLNINVIDKSYDWIGYPDSVAYLWGSERGRHLLDYTGWVDTCLLEGGSHGRSLNNVYSGIGIETYLSAKKWEELLITSIENAPSIEEAFLKNYGEQGIPVQYWNGYLLHIQKYALSCDNYDLLLKSIDWLERYMPETGKNFHKQALSTFCQLVAQKVREAFAEDKDRLFEYEEICKRIEWK